YSLAAKPVCVHCGFDDTRALSIDHINSNGHHLRTKDPTHRDTAKWLKDNGFPDGYQTLCMNCQWIKKVDNNEN
ncbi:hypothetical protein LCGC14_1119380, partial [marine sediment metagenome]